MADRIQRPAFPDELSQVEQRIFDNFMYIADMVAENGAKLDRMEEAITRMEEKINSLQKSQTTRESGVALELGRTTPEPQKPDASSPLLGLEPASPRKPQQGKLLRNALTSLQPPRTPLRGPPLSATTPPRKRRIGPTDHGLRRSLGPSRVLEFIEIPGVEGARARGTDANTETQDDKQPVSSLAGIFDSLAASSNPRLRALTSPLRISPSPLRRSVLSQGLERHESKGKDPKRPFPEDSDDEDGKNEEEGGNGDH